jgi:hypothetical protein
MEKDHLEEKFKKETFLNTTTGIFISQPEVNIIPPSYFINNSNIKVIHIPQQIKQIGKKCFCNCFSLSSIIFLGQIESFDIECFEHCRSLKFIEIPQSVCSIGDGCFWGCSSLSTIVF